MAVERPGAASLRGNPFTVIGAELKPGDTAPDFDLVGAGMSSVSLKDTAGKVRIIATVPSLDTPVCSTETKKWEAQRADLGDIAMITVSMDLPPGQARWTSDADAVLHGLGAWFDTELAAGVGFSNAPDQARTIYGQAFFPFTRPVAVRRGDTVDATLAATRIGHDYVWRWQVRRRCAPPNAMSSAWAVAGTIRPPGRARRSAGGTMPNAARCN